MALEKIIKTLILGAGLAGSVYLFGCGEQPKINIYMQSTQQQTKVYACSDGIDNDGDTLIDNLDPGCYKDGIYIPTKTSEINELPMNKPPILGNIPDVVMDEDTTYNINLSNYVSDPDGDAITYIASGNTNINVIINDGIATLIPNANWNGQEVVTFIACDPGALCSQDSSAITVNPVDEPVTYQCSDGIDNDGDTRTDFEDLGCYTNGLYNPTDNDESDEPIFECSDGIDNDNDGLIDEAEPGCYVNGIYDPTNDESLDKIVNSEITNPLGMTFDGVYFWISDEAGKRVYKLDNNGIILGSFSGPGGKTINGIAYDLNDSNLWFVSYPSGTLYEINKERAIADGNTDNAILSTIGSKGLYTEALAFDGTNLWISISNKIKRVDSITGSVTGEFVDTSPTGGRPVNCTWKDNLVCAYTGTGTPIYEIDTTKALADGNINNAIITTYTPIAQATGIAFDGNKLWYAGSNGTIYFLETE